MHPTTLNSALVLWHHACRSGAALGRAQLELIPCTNHPGASEHTKEVTASTLTGSQDKTAAKEESSPWHLTHRVGHTHMPFKNMWNWFCVMVFPIDFVSFQQPRKNVNMCYGEMSPSLAAGF